VGEGAQAEPPKPTRPCANIQLETSRHSDWRPTNGGGDCPEIPEFLLRREATGRISLDFTTRKWFRFADIAGLLMVRLVA
jgi:hypothetical protein